MAGINDCSNAQLDGKRAAIDLANAQGQEFSQKCWNIDNQLRSANPQYQRDFMNSMNCELQDRQLLPKVELNMVQQSSDETLQTLQNRKKHIDTQDLVRAEDSLRDRGHGVESNLVHSLIVNQDEIKATHAERNFWGKNHDGINMDRLTRWANNSRPDAYGIAGDYNETKNGAAPNARPDAPPVTPHDRPNSPAEAHIDHETRQDNQIKDAQQKIDQVRLEEKIRAGVLKDAHHTVTGSETLNDMAQLALHKAGVVHMTPGLIRREEEKIRIINNLAHGEALQPGTSLMLRTPEEVARESARRMAAYEKSHPNQEGTTTVIERPTHSGRNYESQSQRMYNSLPALTIQQPDDMDPRYGRRRHSNPLPPDQYENY
ncbi:MAG TPA: hypothetical protein V6C76_01420 [Drouetiella sp.]